MRKLLPFILVGVGGFLGANARFLVGQFFSRFFPVYFPLATFTVNVTGSFLLGVISYIAIYLKIFDPDYFRYFLGIGFLGAYTTFSTFEFETNKLVEDGAFLMSAIYVISSVVVGLLAVKMGIETGKLIIKML